MKMPLFPINAILCPHGRISLNVFETKYLDMVSHCLKNNIGFVTVMLQDDGLSESFYRVGTMTKVVDFGQSTQQGILTLTAEGLFQVKLSNIEQQADGLWVSSVIPQPEENYQDLPEQYDELQVVLKALVEHPYVRELNMAINYQDCRHVGWRLTELLPLCHHQKQSLYEMHDPVLRLEKIAQKLSELVE